MLTFSEIITYDSGLLFLLGCGILCFIGMGYIYKSTNKQTDDIMMMSLVFIFGLMFAGLPVLAIINGNIISTTITPCSISENLVADTSETIYSASPEYMIKLHINETKNIIVYQVYLNNIPRIINVTGSGCPPNISGC